MKSYQYIILIVLATMPTLASSQTLSALERAGDNAMESNDYHAAIKHYGEILTIKSERLDIQYKYALAANYFNAFKLAEKSLEKVINTPIKDEELKEELSNAKFWLGNTQKKLGKYDKAIVSFKDFLNDANGSDPLDQELATIANAEIEECDWADSRIKEEDNFYHITHMGDKVNTPSAEFAPVEQNEELYFTTLRFPTEKYKKNRIRSFSKVLLSDDEIISTILVDSDDMTEKHIAHTSFTKEGNQVFFTVCGYGKDKQISCDLYSGKMTAENTWGDLTNLGPQVNIEESTSTQPNVGYEGTQAYLYFVSDRNGGKGGQDIWRAKIGADGKVGQPRNVQTVNTENDDITPYFHDKTQTLYFSTNGRKSLGGFDVYQIKQGQDQVKHAGYPLNSSYDDIYYSLGEDESRAYISSNRPSSMYLVDSLEACCFDLFKIDFENKLDLLANVIDDMNEEPILGAIATITETIYDETMTESKDDTHIYPISILRNRSYDITFEKEGYHPNTVKVSTLDLTSLDDLEETVRLTPLPISLSAFAADEDNRQKLAGVTYTLSLKEDGEWTDVKTLSIEDLRTFDLDIFKNNDYRITASREDYHDKVLEFDTYDIVGGTTKSVELLLKKMTPSEIIKKSIDEFLPVPLYFDNDRPKPVSSIGTTDKTYGQLNDEYYLRKGKFLQTNTAGLTGEALTIASGDVNTFFDLDVLQAKASLNTFCAEMLEYLELGNTGNIMIQGYASPLATDEYNLNLGSRRTSSIQNHISEWSNGALLPYIDAGKLRITFKSFGETNAAPGISDNPADLKSSLYSISASRERRVQIIEVK